MLLFLAAAAPASAQQVGGKLYLGLELGLLSYTNTSLEVAAEGPLRPGVVVEAKNLGTFGQGAIVLGLSVGLSGWI